MYRNLIIVIILALSVNTYGQFGIQNHYKKKVEKHFQKEGEKQAQKGIDAGLNEADKGIEAGLNEADKGLQAFDDWAEDEFADELVYVDENLIDASNIQWQRLRFVTGQDILFYDKPFNFEKDKKAPSNWYIKKKSHTEISEFDQGKMITAAGEGYLTPMVANTEEDYLPNDFTFEFDFMMPVSPFSKPMNINFYAKEKQSRKGFWPIKINKNIVTYKDSSAHYPVLYLDENGMDNWYRFSVSFNNGLIKIYLNERLMITYQDEIEPTGISIDYMAYTPIFFKNFILATNCKLIEDQINSGSYTSYNVDYVTYKGKLSGRSISELAPIANLLIDQPDMKIEADVYFSQHEKNKDNTKFGKEKAQALHDVMTAMGVKDGQFSATFIASIHSEANNDENRKSEAVIFRKK
ncbi:MAG: hypothetical protein GQ527_13080 [Bacteroidales bacterium]|nr:hypothetical protein [Bacteroidales bacterium]